MLLSEQLRTAGLRVFPCWVRQDPSTGKWLKGPSVPKGVSWKDAADLPGLDWSAKVLGLPVPPRVLIVDLDSYKGVTRVQVEAHLGCPLDWDQAIIQQTIGGGEHYAFLCDWDAKHDSSLPGMDTRAAGKGFICTGEGYTPVGMGVFRLACPDSLPRIPDAARDVLEVQAPPPPKEHAPAELTDDQLFEALRYIDPGCDRAEWVRVGLALKHHYQEDDDAGRDVFDRWSAGEFWQGPDPDNYVQDHIDHQWSSFKAEGGVTVATLYYKAIQCGWTPPSTFDTASAFGADAAPAGVFERLVERVQESGGDIRQTAALVQEIQASGCNALQITLLAAELKSSLRDAGIKDRQVSSAIDSNLEPGAPPGSYGKSDAVNASIFITRRSPNGTLIKCDGELYAFTGKVWSLLPLDLLKHMIATDMAADFQQNSRISSCTDLVLKLSPTYDGVMNAEQGNGRILFDNGVLDLATRRLDPHSMHYYTTIILPYPYDPGASTTHWDRFLYDVFDGDQELAELLQEWFGYMLVRDYRFHKVLLLLGPPRCGKGTIGRVLELLVGADNFSGGSLSSFARDSFIDSLRTKPVLFVGDAAKRVPPAKVNEVIERIKSISGNDAVDFDRKYLKGLSDTLPTRITIAANGVPNLFDDSGALASRMQIIPFTKSFYGREDLTLIDKLRGEMPGIANWALAGLERLMSRGKFTEPVASREETEALRETYSPMMQFIQECCVLDPSAHCTTQEIYEAYRNFVLRQQEDLLRPKSFVSSFRDATRGHGVQYGRVDQVRGFRGVAPLDMVEATAPRTAAAFKVVK